MISYEIKRKLMKLNAIQTNKQITWNHMKSNEIKWKHVKSYKICWNQMKSTEIKWYAMKSNEINLNQKQKMKSNELFSRLCWISCHLLWVHLISVNCSRDFIIFRIIVVYLKYSKWFDKMSLEFKICHVISVDWIGFHMISKDFLGCQKIWYDFMWFHLISYDFIGFHIVVDVMWFHWLSFHWISSDVMWFRLLS